MGSLLDNYVFKVELLMIAGVICLLLYILFQLKVFGNK